MAIVVQAWAELTNQIEIPCDEAPPTDELIARIQEAIWQFCYPYHINNSVSHMTSHYLCSYSLCAASTCVVCDG